VRLQSEPECRTHVVARLCSHELSPSRLSRSLVRTENSWRSDQPTERALQQVGAVLIGQRRPITGARGVAAVRDRRARLDRAVSENARGEPVVWQEHVPDPICELRLVLRQPAQLGDGRTGYG